MTELSKSFLYGTAWKEDNTQHLTRMALEAGFRGIDTANQRKHYHEAGVGEAIQAAFNDGVLERGELFLQTKFTFQAGQDHRLPYNPSDPIPMQVQQSIASSLRHLQTSYLDSLLLHGPSQRIGLGQADWDAWRTMEALHDQGTLRSLGISNVSFSQLNALVEKARVRPRWVQNRCFAVEGWDRHVRDYCRAQAITYQGFSLLTANAKFLAEPALISIATRHDCSVAQVIFRYAMDVGMVPLTGTTSSQHMRDDLRVFDLRLTVEEVQQVENIGSET